MLLRTFKRVLRGKIVCLLAALFLVRSYKQGSDLSDDQLSHLPSTIILLDLSTSMNTTDMADATSRLKYAKSLITQYITENDGPVGLIAFNDTSKIITPPTQDKETFLQKLSLLHTRSLVNSGSNIPTSEMLSQVIDMGLKSTQSPRSFILISDFDSTESDVTLPTQSDQNDTFSIIALGETTPQQLIDADGTFLTEQSAGRNDSLAKRVSSELNGSLQTNPEILTPLQPSTTTQKSSQRKLRIAAVFFLLSL